MINDQAIALPQVNTNNSFDELLTALEVDKAIEQLSNSNAPGSDGIPSELHKCGRVALTAKLTELFQLIWEQQIIPQEFKDASIVHLSIHQPSHRMPYNKPSILVRGKQYEVVDRFVHLGSTLSRAVNIDEEATSRIAKASSTVFERQCIGT